MTFKSNSEISKVIATVYRTTKVVRCNNFLATDDFSRRLNKDLKHFGLDLVIFAKITQTTKSFSNSLMLLMQYHHFLSELYTVYLSLYHNICRILNSYLIIYLPLLQPQDYQHQLYFFRVL